MRPRIVGDDAVKISYIRVVPGEEADVYSAVNEACQMQEDIKRHAILKSFGHNDLVLIYEVENFDFQLSDHGPIPGILSSHQSLCFPYMGTNCDDLFSNISNSLCSGFSLIKYKNDLKLSSYNLENSDGSLSIQRVILDIEQTIIDSIEEPSKTFILGSIGWNETIVVFCHDCIEKSIRNTTRLNSNLYLINYIEKFFSFLTVNYKWLPKSKELLTNPQATVEFLNNQHGLSKTINQELFSINVYIASQPCNLKEINDWWKGTKIKPQAVLGLYDLSYSMDGGHDITWSELLTYILTFRHEFNLRLKATSTIIRLKDLDLNPEPQTTLLSSRVDEQFGAFVYFDTKVFNETLDISTSKFLANNIYALNSLLQNPISGQAFEPMCYFAQSIVNRINKCYREKENGESDRVDINREAFFAYSLISSGCDLRSYGTFGNMERPHIGGYYRQRAGVQLALRALEFIPSYLIDRLGNVWDGFIIVEEPKFYHVTQVITVPCESLWRPADYWWAMYHETGHIFLETNDLINRSDSVIGSLLLNRSDKDKTFNLLVELVAELFGFLVGFFNDYELFTEVLLHYLSRIAPNEKQNINLTDYLFRILFVKFYSMLYVDQTMELKDLSNNQYLFTESLNHIEKCKSYLKEVSDYDYFFQLETFYAVNWADTMHDIKELLPYLHAKIQALDKKIEPELNKEEEIFLNEVYESIIAGNVHYGPIPCPEYLLFLMYKGRANFSFKSNIAAVLTFANVTDNEIYRFTQ